MALHPLAELYVQCDNGGMGRPDKLLCDRCALLVLTHIKRYRHLSSHFMGARGEQQEGGLLHVTLSFTAVR